MRVAFVGLLLGWAAFGQEESGREDWPRLLGLDQGRRLVVHQPQVESWTRFSDLTIRAAINLEGTDGAGEPNETLGTVRVSMRTAVDLRRGVALISDPKILGVEGIDQPEAVAARILREVKSGSPELDLEDLLAGLDRKDYPIEEVAVSVKPPKLIFSPEPAILVTFDGAPQTAPIAGTDLLLALNSPSLIFQQTKTGWWYMLGWDTWVKTRDLVKGPWVPAPTLPSTFGKLPDDETWGGLKKKIPGRRIERKEMPRIHVAFEPTELVVVFGPPKFLPVPGTELAFVENSEQDIFLHAKQGNYYLLLSGRWYRARSADAALEFCTDKLPPDFAKIPPDHVAARVRSSVPGTPEADDALLLNALPRKATVKRGSIDLKLKYRGVPKFAKRDGIEYAVNIGVDVFRVGETCYCCSDGIWFTAERPAGPWKLCSELPAEFDAIGVESPFFNVRFVRIDHVADDAVTYSYTPGYAGCYVHGGVVVYGTGHPAQWPAGFWQAGWEARDYWLKRWRRDDLHQWHRHLTFGQARWYDPVFGLFRMSFDAMSHAKFRMHQAQAYRTWNGKAVLPLEERRNPEPEVKKARKKPRIAKSRGQLYAGANGKVYKYAHGVWFRDDGGKWTSLSGKPTLQSDVDRRKRLQKARESRERSYYQNRRNRRYRRRGFLGRRGIWGGSIVGIGGGWGGAGWGGGGCGGIGIGGW